MWVWCVQVWHRQGQVVGRRGVGGRQPGRRKEGGMAEGHLQLQFSQAYNPPEELFGPSGRGGKGPVAGRCVYRGINGKVGEGKVWGRRKWGTKVGNVWGGWGQGGWKGMWEGIEWNRGHGRKAGPMCGKACP